MIIAAKRYYSWSVALCEEVRRTDKRVYVRFIEGDSSVVSGRSPNWYVDIDQVITDKGTREQFKDIRVAITDHNNMIGAMEHRIRIERDSVIQKIQDLLKQ